MADADCQMADTDYCKLADNRLIPIISRLYRLSAD